MSLPIDPGRCITLSWTVEEAEETAHVLHSAALDKKGRVFDIGFEQDALSIWCQIEALSPNAGRDDTQLNTRANARAASAGEPRGAQPPARLSPKDGSGEGAP